MMACRTGCRTQNHANWGECARDSGLQIGDLGTGRGVAKRTDQRLGAYQAARQLGLQPPTTKTADSVRTLHEAGAL
jgi:hypothetical protein